jgi:DegV family protein with EDD domain
MTSKRIRIAADSVCDLPADVVSALNIKVIPTYVNIGDKSIPDDGAALIREDFYKQLPSMTSQPTSAAPSPGDAESFYRQSLEDADHLVSIHVPAKLSGVHNTMRLGAQAVDAEKVTLVDSLQLSMGIGMQVWVAAEVAQETDDVNEVLDAIERVRQNLRLYAIIDTMEYLKRSGRVSSLLAGLGTFLKIKPIVTVLDGEISSYARVRTWSRAESKLRELTKTEAPLDRLAIMHIDNRAGAEKFLESIRDIAPEKTVIIEVTPTLGTHIGPGSLGVTTLSKNWRQ